MKTEMPERRLPGVIFGLLAVTVSTHTSATGFFLNQQSVLGFGRAQAGNAAIANDASTVFFNPAGMTRLESNEFQLNVHVVFPSADLHNRGTTAATPATGGVSVPVMGNDGGNPGSTTPLGNAYYVNHVSDAVALGLGLSMPFGLGTEYDRGWFGRYDLLKSELLTVNIAPTIAYGTDQWSIGAGLDIQYADAELSNAVPNPLVPGGPTVASDGLFQLEGDDTSVGFNVGALLTLDKSDNTTLGIHFRSSIRHELAGTARTSGLTGPLASANRVREGKVELELPPIATVGLAHRRGPWTWLGQLAWFGWDSFDEIRVQFTDGSPGLVDPTGFQDAYAISIGAEYALDGGQLDGITLRGGIAFEESIVNDDFRDTSLPDSDHYRLAGGLSWDFSKDWCTSCSLDFSAVHLIYDDAKIDLIESFPQLQSSVSTRAEAEKSSTIVSVGLRKRF
jgi:long-chain fatty acid transport protein